MKYNIDKLILFLSIVIITFIGYIFTPLETFVNSTLIISNGIIDKGKLPLSFDGGGWFKHAEMFLRYPYSMVLLAIISLVINVTVSQIIFIPVLMPIVVILVYLLSHNFLKDVVIKFFKNITFTLIYLAFIIYFIVNTINLYTISYHSLGYTFILFTIFSMRFLINNIKNLRSTIIAITIFSIASAFTYYFASVFIVLIFVTSLLTIIFFVVNGIIKELNAKRIDKYVYTLLSFTILVFVLELIYARVLPHIVFKDISYYLLESIFGIIYRNKDISVYESVIYINNEAKILLQQISYKLFPLNEIGKFNYFYLNGITGLLFSILLLFKLTSIFNRTKLSFLVLYLSVYYSSLIHMLIYYLTYGTLGTRAYQFFFIPLNQIVIILLTESFLDKRVIQKIFVCIFSIISAMSSIVGIQRDIIDGFWDGYFRSSSYVTISSQYQCITLSSLLENNVEIFTDYIRSQFMFRGFILNKLIGNVRWYGERTKEVFEMLKTGCFCNDKLITEIAWLVAEDNFRRPVYGDIAAYIAPPFDANSFMVCLRGSNVLFNSGSLWLIVFK